MGWSGDGVVRSCWMRVGTLMAVGAVVLLLSCCRDHDAGAYADLDDLFERGVPTTGFRCTAFNIPDEGPIEFMYYTRGGDDDGRAIETAIEAAKDLTVNIRKRRAVKLVFMDGCETITIGSPAKPGQEIRTVVLERLPE